MKHLAIIADGNRRWAKKNALKTVFGHREGLTCIERICEWAIDRNISFLTVYCFSTENWGREKVEVDNIMNLARDYFSNIAWYVNRGIRVQFSGRRDRVQKDVVEIMQTIENDTAACSNLTLILCVDYGGRDEIVRAVENGARTEEEITAALCGSTPCPEVILRTGGHHRLSNFLLWQGAYSELMFTDTLFPDLCATELDSVLDRYASIQRNFGK